MSYLSSYLNRIRMRGNYALADAIQTTVDKIAPRYINDFSFTDHVVGLLLGDVQSGKTSHMFGLICAAADAGFMNFVLLTTDISLLQIQTQERAERDLCDFCICGENDYVKYTQNNLSRPVVIVLKKNSRVLRKWKNDLASSQLCIGNPLFIVDDEADAASLNTLVNKNKQSTINKELELIKRTTSSSIYLEVTGTPEAILLQTKKSGWKPYFIYYFLPGSTYLGGNFFFPDNVPSHVILTDDDEAQDIASDDEYPENGLKRALITHLISSAYILSNGGKVNNFLIHPSVRTSEHEDFAEKVGNYLNEISHSYDEEETKQAFFEVYEDLAKTKPDIISFDATYAFIIKLMQNDGVCILTLNSKEAFVDSSQYSSGVNILVGGNSLGRGVTFPQLQTIYYCRVAKSPQADTMWQHARMFGYDRDPQLLRLFLPPKLYKLFSNINRTNNSIIRQIQRMSDGFDVKIVMPKGLKPTRKNVIDKRAVGIYSGGVNYFPFYPVNASTAQLDELLLPFDDNLYSVSIKYIIKVLEHVSSEASEDWDSGSFIGFANALLDADASAQGTLIVRRNRDIGRETGTLLSPNDRSLGDSITDRIVLTMYKITGNLSKGWNGEQIWIPNIKLPGDDLYYTGENQD